MRITYIKHNFPNKLHYFTLTQWFPTWGPRKAVRSPQNDYRGSKVEKGWEPLH